MNRKDKKKITILNKYYHYFNLFLKIFQIISYQSYISINYIIYKNIKLIIYNLIFFNNLKYNS